MTAATKILARLCAIAALVGTLCAASALAQDNMSQMSSEGRVDKRKLTTVQASAVDVGHTKGAVEVRYLNLPFGEATFNYIETGNDPRNQGYYAGRTWPIAHLRLNAPATWAGKKLAPGDYAIVITPANAKENKSMMLSLASFTPGEGGTFLKAGNVFVDTPKDANIVVSKPIKFDKGAPAVDHLVIDTARNGRTVWLKFHYGDRTLNEKLTM
ncbi:MAG TPA: hypothetical protein VF525_06970 [Pyrinomonadaceae bacterium]|jgi:hypothetical protein